MPSQNAIRTEITNQIVEALEENLLPWRRPWSVSGNSGRPSNVASKSLYSGVNPLLLELHSLRYGLSSKWFGTFRQWSDRGCTVKQRPRDVKSGQWGCKIVFARPITKEVTNAKGDKDEKSFFMLRTFTVFNADQVEGEFAESLQVQGSFGDDDLPNYEPAEEVITATNADVRHGGDQAFYRPSGDYIQMPHRHQFDPVGTYYESLLHELAHWSESRLEWEANYAMNELVAEMTASFLSTELCIPQGESFENHASYIKGWLKAMKNDPSFIFKASTQASKVADYLLSFSKTEVTDTITAGASA